MTSKARLIEIYGSEEAVAAHYREMQKKSRLKYKGTGGFAYLKKNDPDKMKQIAKLGGQSGGKRTTT